jgi:peptidoglycan/LPS O-acetylase OafA/YrhL
VALTVAALEVGGLLVGVLSWRPLATVGRLSYGAYLWNYPIAVVLDLQFGIEGHVWVGLLAIALTGVAAALSFKYIEQPFLRKKSQLRSATLAV